MERIYEKTECQCIKDGLDEKKLSSNVLSILSESWMTSSTVNYILGNIEKFDHESIIENIIHLWWWRFANWWRKSKNQ